MSLLKAHKYKRERDNERPDDTYVEVIGLSSAHAPQLVSMRLRLDHQFLKKVPIAYSRYKKLIIPVTMMGSFCYFCEIFKKDVKVFARSV